MLMYLGVKYHEVSNGLVKKQGKKKKRKKKKEKEIYAHSPHIQKKQYGKMLTISESEERVTWSSKVLTHSTLL
jgi:hypothetical protein